jgi:hypothetical protein
VLPAGNGKVRRPSAQELAHGADESDPDPTTGNIADPYGTRADAENDPLYQAAYGLQGKLPDEAQPPEKNR